MRRYWLWMAPLAIAMTLMGSLALGSMPLMAATTAATAPTVEITNNKNTVVLNWIDDRANDNGYQILRSLTPYPKWEALTPYATLPAGTTTFTDTDVLLNKDRLYSYVVVGLSSRSPHTAYSKPVGAWRLGGNGASAPSGPDPDNEGMLAWSQQYQPGGQRDVLIRWFDFAPDTTVEIYRSIENGPYSLVGQTTFAADHSEMKNELGADIFAILTNDLVDDPADPPLTDVQLYEKLKANGATAISAGERYYQAALATGMAFIDKNAPQSVDLAYYIRPANSTADLTHYPVCVPYSQPRQSPTNLRESEIVSIPGDMGHIGSTQPYSTAERFNFSQFRDVQQRHGQVFLTWDDQAGVTPPNNPQECVDAPQLAVVGYTAFRRQARVHGTTWQQITATPYLSQTQFFNLSGQSLNDNFAEADAGSCDQATEICPVYGGEYSSEPYNIGDNVAELYEDSIGPKNVFTEWDYRVCTVDRFGQELGCQTLNDVYVHELLPPAPPEFTPDSVTVNYDELSEQGKGITLTWRYSDTDEHRPVRMHISLSDDYEADRSSWTRIAKTVLVKEGQVTYTMFLTEGLFTENQATWFTIQARDDAGNWSAPATPVWGMLADRTPPDPAQIDDYKACDLNTFPLTFDNLDSDAIQARLYRRFDAPPEPDPFDPIDDWQLIRQYLVSNQSVTIDDEYIPPQGIDLYYALELVDGNGNVSDPIHWCTQKEGGDPSFPPRINVNKSEPVGNALSFDNWSPYNGTAEVTIPGSDGLESYPVDIESSLIVTPAIGMTTIDIYNEDEDQPFYQTFMLWNTNNFMDTNRQMTDLGEIKDIRWIGDGVIYSHTVQIDFEGEVFNSGLARPMVAVFRRTADSNWTQVISVTHTQEVKRWQVFDRSDPDPTQDYQYTALAISPETYEVLGFWRTYSLSRQFEPEILELATPLERPVIPRAADQCHYIQVSPGGSAPSAINLAQGWVINVDQYYINTGQVQFPPPNCPTSTTFSAMDAFGHGMLSDPTGTFATPVQFAGIGIDPRLGANLHTSGDIIVDIETAGSRWLNYTQLRFIGGKSGSRIDVEKTYTLPDQARLINENNTNTRYQVIIDVENGVTPVVNRKFGLDIPVTPPVFTDYYLTDESIPWWIDADDYQLNSSSLSLVGGIRTISRLYDPIPISNDRAPDNNANLFRGEYISSDLTYNSSGLDGTFTSNTSLEYITSLPASFLVQADAATLTFVDSTISSGLLENAQVTLRYYTGQMINDVAELSEDDGAVLRKGYRPWDDSYEVDLYLPLQNGELSVGPSGRLVTGLPLNEQFTWPSFATSRNEQQVHLYITGASFADDGNNALNAPTPAEVAWRRLPHPTEPAAELDPGVNMTYLADEIFYACYDPDEFRGDVELYLRRGGVSEFVRIQGVGEDEYLTNMHGYQEALTKFEAVFIDNGILPDSTLDVLLNLYLPYPSETIFKLRVNHLDPASNCPSGGEFDDTSRQRHDFWNFHHTPVAGPGGWRYTATDMAHYGGSGYNTLFYLIATAELEGLNEDGGNAATRLDTVESGMISSWFPHGDIGSTSISFGDGATALPGYRVNGMPFAVSRYLLGRFYGGDAIKGTGDPLNFNVPEDRAPHLPAGIGLTSAALKDCVSKTSGVGCGMVMVDGTAAFDYFGELQLEDDIINASNPVQVASATLIGPRLRPAANPGSCGLPIDCYRGFSPIVTVGRDGVSVQVTGAPNRVNWQWPQVNENVNSLISDNYPVKFMGNSDGAVVVGFEPNRSILTSPGPELLKGDVAVIASVHWLDNTNDYTDYVSIFGGQTAAQAALRALAMNRPLADGSPGVQPFKTWSDVSTDIVAWANDFNMPINGGSNDDSVDLAQQLWNNGDWQDNETELEFTHAFDVVRPYIEQHTQADGFNKPVYGSKGLESGDILVDIGTHFYNANLSAIFISGGLSNGDASGLSNLTLDRLGVATQFELILTDDSSSFMKLDWLSASYDRDGSFWIYGENLYIDALEDVIEGPIVEWFDIRYEDDSSTNTVVLNGGIELGDFDLTVVELNDIASVFGFGKRNNKTVGYLGLGAEVKWESVRLSGFVLAGAIDVSSETLRDSLERLGYEAALDKFDENFDDPIVGFYLAAEGEIPVTDNGCLLRVEAHGALRVWYYDASPGIYGGQIMAGATGQFACLLSARAELALAYENLNNGMFTSAPPGWEGGEWANITQRQCVNPAPNGQCEAFTGGFWIATGVGFDCDRGTWRSWPSRWWGDSWCYTFGAGVAVSYMDPAPGNSWRSDFDIDFE